MENTLLSIEKSFSSVASFACLIIEIIGFAIILYAVIKGLIIFIKNGFNFEIMHKDLTINHGFSFGLEVLLASEIIKTITIKSMDNLKFIVVLVLIRIFIAYMLGIEAKHKSH